MLDFRDPGVSETSATVPSRLNAPIVLWRLKNLTLPARVGLKLSTWRLESVAGLLSTRLAYVQTSLFPLLHAEKGRLRACNKGNRRLLHAGKTRLATTVYCPLRWRFRTFEMGILAMWTMENVRYLSGHLFLAELSPCHKCYGNYRRRERSRSREVCKPSLLFSLLSSWWKTVAQKKALNSA